MLDFTALGDAVNVGARLQAHAAPGEVVLAASLYPLIEESHLSEPGPTRWRFVAGTSRSRL